MKYKTGDKVLIRNDLKIDNVYNDYYYNEYMHEFKNKLATITNYYTIDGNKVYTIDLDNGMWFWNSEMFSGKLVGNKIIEGE